MDRKKFLIVAVTMMSIAGLVATCVPFSSSMNPPRHAVDKWQVEIDVSNLTAGELKDFDQSIWVYRRTAEQIIWLENYSPVEVVPFVKERSYSENYGGKFRSIDKEYFVFRVWERRNTVYLQQENTWHACGELKYYDGSIAVSNEKVFKGVIACDYEHENLKFDDWGHYYDVAGISSNRYFMPLEVPHYEINSKGNIVVGPKHEK